MVKNWKGNASFGTIGLELVLCLMVGLLGGRWLDTRLGTTPWLAMLGFFFGLAAGAKAVWRGYREMQVITAREEREQGNPPPRFDPGEEPDEPARPDSDREEGDGAEPADSAERVADPSSRPKDDDPS